MPSLSGQKSQIDEMWHGYMQAHEEMINRMRGLIVPKEPIDPGAFLDEYLSANASPLIMTPNIDRTILVTSILYAFTPLANATLVIGQASGTNRTIPIVATTNNVPASFSCSMIIKPGDTLTLTCGGATALFLEIMGKVLSGTNWSVV